MGIVRDHEVLAVWRPIEPAPDVRHRSLRTPKRGDHDQSQLVLLRDAPQKGDLLPVGRPRRVSIPVVSSGQLDAVSLLDLLDVDMLVSEPAPRVAEGKDFPVWGEPRTVLQALQSGERPNESGLMPGGWPNKLTEEEMVSGKANHDQAQRDDRSADQG